MARRKETVTQRDFSLGAVRPEGLEREDTTVIERSVAEAKNTIALTTGQIEDRPGTLYLNDTGATEGVECDLGSGRRYDLHIVSGGVVLYNEDGTVAFSETSSPWISVTGKYGTFTFEEMVFWVIPDPDSSSILIGSKNVPIHALVLDAGSWSFGVADFANDLANVIGQPYWRYHRGVTIAPSARTGSITVTASEGIWTDDHVGTAIRYVDREIILGSRVSATVMNATVTEELTRTYDITVSDASGFQKGEVVEDETLGGRGVITNISGSVLTVLATEKFNEFASSNNLIGPNTKSNMTTVADASPAATYLWDAQMLSPVYGYPGYAARHQNRVYLCDFPSAPQGFAAGVVGGVMDFTMGPDDGDGFVDVIGADSGGDLKFIVSAEDLLFMTTRGLYYQTTRDGSAVTPTTIAPVRFSRIGCSAVRPVAVDDGAVFVNAVGQQVYAAVLAGDIYKSWRADALSKYHSHLIESPQYLGATSSGSEKPEEFIYAVNADGTAAICQWNRSENFASWRRWETTGQFKAIYQCFGKTYCVADRVINSVSRTMRERFETGLVMDCVAAVKVSTTYPGGEAGAAFFAGVTAFATHLDGHTATVYMEGWDIGDWSINTAGKPLDADGNLLTYPDYEGIVQIGLPWEMKIVPWARRSVNTFRGTREVKRQVELMVSVQDTGQFQIDGRTFGAYRVGEDLSQPPPVRTKEFRVEMLGGDPYKQIEITKSRPGPFRLTKLRYRVVV